jgi:polyhydroxybutyrate depolymerase
MRSVTRIFFFVVLGLVTACSVRDRKESVDASAPVPDAPAPTEPLAPTMPTPTPTPTDMTDAGPPPPATTVTTEAIMVGALAREIVLVVPATLKPSPYPLVLVFHGDGGTGASMRAAYPFDDATGASAIVAYPSGKNGRWDLYRPEATNEDFAFLDALLANLRSRFSIDRIFATGFSSGAFLANQIACRRSGLLLGIAVNGGGAPAEPQDPNATYWPNGTTRCANQTTGVAAIVIHGDADTVVGTGSGDYAADYWADVNGCQRARASVTPPPCEQHAACPAAMPVVYCGIPGLGHSLWAGGVSSAWAFFQSL